MGTVAMAGEGARESFPEHLERHVLARPSVTTDKCFECAVSF